MGRPAGAKNKKNGSGVENADTIRDRLAAELQQISEDGTVPLEGLVEVSVLALFIVQKLGQASLDQVLEQARGIHAAIDPYLLEQALEALRARQLLSYVSGRKKGTGESNKQWKIKQAIWSSSPEMAHVKDLLPALVSTDEAQGIIDLLNGSEEAGEGKPKAKTRLGYDEFWDIRIHFRSLTPILGSQPDSPFLKRIVEESGIKFPVAQLRFWRDENAVMIPSDVVAGWLRTNSRIGMGAPEAAASYIATSDIKIVPKRALEQVALPVIDPRTKQGKGLNTYEILPKGTEFSALFRVPARGFLEPEDFVLWIASMAPVPIRGLSPARGKRFGKMEVTSYKVLGATASAATMLTSVMEELSEEGQIFYAQLVTRAKDVNFRSRPKGGFEGEDDSEAEAEAN